MNLIKKTLSLTVVLICFISTNVAIAQNQGVSADVVQEYETLISKCFDKEGNPTEITVSDVKRLEDIYIKMSDVQKEEATKVASITNERPEKNKNKNPLPQDAVYYIDGEKSTMESAMEIIEQGKFKIVRKKVDGDYEFHIETLD